MSKNRKETCFEAWVLFPRSVCRTRNRIHAHPRIFRRPNNVVGGDMENEKRIKKEEKNPPAEVSMRRSESI